LITTTNPRTGASSATDVRETTIAEVDELAARAQAAAVPLERLGRAARARLLDAVAQSLEADREELVRVADQETGLGETRLNGELSRAAFQFGQFAQALREGSYLEAAIDHAGDTPLGPGPDLRRMLLPIGPVAVFGASNFPFAFSVAGGDTASALAADCPVLLKAHDSHPLTSLRSFEAIARALSGDLGGDGAPDGTIALVFGQDAAGRMVSHPNVRAVSFTGSLSTGRVLLDIVNRREDPIPFYGELSSLNPLVVTPGAAKARTDDIAQGLFASFTGSGGQLCTKPGMAFVPTGPDGDRVVDRLREMTESGSGHVLLNKRIADAFGAISTRLVDAGASVAARGPDPDADGFVVPPVLLTTDAADLTGELTEECFGPLVVVARYDDVKEVARAFEEMPPSLTATVHAEVDETELVTELTRMLVPGVGRLVFNGYPTGVRVSWAQHHGGPWPSTNSQHTSVGISAIRRFLRPFVWQSAPEAVLPEELRDGYTGIARRVDGVLVPAEGGAR
jgi:NADP-dependent aldehyde dehydrogenase